MKAFLHGTWLFVVFVTAGWTQNSGLRFDVASIKPNNSGGLGARTPFPPGGRFSATNAPLKLLIRLAYGFADYQISGGPDWIRVDRFDVEAKSDANPSQETIKIMMQGLLEDRFHLKVHRETRQDTVYALTVSKGGSKLKPVPGDNTENLRNDAWHGVKAGQGHLFTTKGEVAGLVAYLTQIMDRPVIDKTGLNKFYEFDFTVPGTILPSPDSTQSIFEAIQDQLGLRLEQTKGPIEFLVVDHVDRLEQN